MEAGMQAGEQAGEQAGWRQGWRQGGGVQREVGCRVWDWGMAGCREGCGARMEEGGGTARGNGAQAAGKHMRGQAQSQSIPLSLRPSIRLSVHPSSLAAAGRP